MTGNYQDHLSVTVGAVVVPQPLRLWRVVVDDPESFMRRDFIVEAVSAEAAEVSATSMALRLDVADERVREDEDVKLRTLMRKRLTASEESSSAFDGFAAYATATPFEAGEPQT